MLDGRPQPGGHEERTEPLRSKPRGVRFIIQPETADVRGRTRDRRGYSAGS